MRGEDRRRNAALFFFFQLINMRRHWSRDESRGRGLEASLLACLLAC
jgi:hypothetical protein